MKAAVIDCTPAREALCRLVLAAADDDRVTLDIDAEAGEATLYQHGIASLTSRAISLDDVAGLYHAALEVARRPRTGAWVERSTEDDPSTGGNLHTHNAPESLGTAADDAALADRLAEHKRHRFGRPHTRGAYAYALGGLTALLADMYRRHGAPQWHRDHIDDREHRHG